MSTSSGSRQYRPATWQWRNGAAARGGLRGRRLSSRVHYLIGALVNLGVILYVQSGADTPALIFSVSAAFWAVLLLRPSVVDRGNFPSPKNFVVFLFFVTMVVAPPLMVMGQGGKDFAVLQPAVWEYIGETSLLWAAGFLAYALGLERLGLRRQRGSDYEDRPPVEEPAIWMAVAGLALICCGVAGISIAAGSIRGAVAMGGMRSAAYDVLQTGTYRYVVWLEAAPIGACLLWYYVLRQLRLGAVGGMVAAIMLYVPMIPFYMYSSGRARTLVPFFLLLAMYHRYCHRIATRWLAVGVLVVIPLLGVWDDYRRGLGEYRVGLDRVAEVVAADFARFDVSALAVAGFREGGLTYLYGETVVKAALHILPPRFTPSGLTGGTEAMGRAIFADPNWDRPSSFATPLVMEGFLNFSFAGVIVFLFGLGAIVRRLHRMYAQGSILAVLFALAVTVKLPFGVSLENSVSQIVWAVIVPLLTIWLTKALLASSARVAKARL